MAPLAASRRLSGSGLGYCSIALGTTGRAICAGLVDADTLLAAAGGPAAAGLRIAAHTSSPRSPMGQAGLVALNRAGEIVGYGRGTTTLVVERLPRRSRRSSVATGDNHVQAWSFANLEEVGRRRHRSGRGSYGLLQPDLHWGPTSSSFSPAAEPGTIPEMTLSHYVSGAERQVVSEDIVNIIPTRTGLLAIGGDGVVHRVDPPTGDLRSPHRSTRRHPWPDRGHCAVSRRGTSRRRHRRLDP